MTKRLTRRRAGDRSLQELVCPRCKNPYRTRADGWVCRACEAEGAIEALVGIATAVLRSATVTLATCPADGCLITPGEVCPACQARAAARIRRHGSKITPRGDARIPIGWVRKGPILVKRRAA